MTRLSAKRLTGILSIALTAGLLASPAGAYNRCGGSLFVDAPTTFLKVARQCNVAIADLKEANPGVDPDNVRPGEYLSLANQVVSHARQDTMATQKRIALSTPIYGRSPLTKVYVPWTPGPKSQPAATRASAPVQTHHVMRSKQMSFQDYAAHRIRFSAKSNWRNGLSMVPIQSIGDPAPAANAGPTKLAPPAGHALDDKISAEGGYRVPDYNTIGLKVSDLAPNASGDLAIEGEVTDASRGCMLVETSAGNLYRVAHADAADDLLGKAVIIWGALIAGGACGEGPSIAMSHAVYAEPLAAD